MGKKHCGCLKEALAYLGEGQGGKCPGQHTCGGGTSIPAHMLPQSCCLEGHLPQPSPPGGILKPREAACALLALRRPLRAKLSLLVYDWFKKTRSDVFSLQNASKGGRSHRGWHLLGGGKHLWRCASRAPGITLLVNAKYSPQTCTVNLPLSKNINSEGEKGLVGLNLDFAHMCCCSSNSQSRHYLLCVEKAGMPL